MKRCRCRSLLLPTTRIGTSLLLLSLQERVRHLKIRRLVSKQHSERHDVCHSGWLGVCKDVYVQFFPFFWGVWGRIGGLELAGSRGLPPHSAVAGWQHCEVWKCTHARDRHKLVVEDLCVCDTYSYSFNDKHQHPRCCHRVQLFSSNTWLRVLRNQICRS